MKIKRKIGVFVAAVMAFTMSITAQAESITKDGLTTEIIADNNYYESNETAEIVVKVTNNNDFAVKNVSAESIIPEGLEIVDSSGQSFSNVDLDAGETQKFTLQVAKIGEDSSEDSVSDASSEESVESNVNSDVSSDDSIESTLDSDVVSSKADDNTQSPSKDEESKLDSDTSSKSDSSQIVAAGNKNDDSSESDSSAVYADSNSNSPDTGVKTALIILAILGGLIVISILGVIGYKKKKLLKVISLALCAAMVGTVTAQVKAAAEQEQNTYSVSSTLIFDNANYELTTITKYDPIVTDTDKTYTRGEWVKLIADVEDIDPEKFGKSAVDYFYGDTRNTEDGKLYEIVHDLGILPDPDNEGYVDPEQDIPMFEADKQVTREFAAYTAVKALGFVGQKDAVIDCTDADSIKYKSEAALALKFNLLSLIDGAFAPNDLITEADKNQIIAVIKSMDESTVVDEDEDAHEINFADGVIAEQLKDLTDYKAVKNDDGTYTVTLPVNDVTKTINKDTVFVLPENEQFIAGASFKAVSVTETAKSITAVCTIPDIKEVAKSIYLMDNVSPDASSFVPAEGVTASIPDSAESSDDAAPINIDEGSEWVDVWSKEFGNLKLSIPSVSVKLKAHIGFKGVGVDEASFAVTSRADLSFEKSAEYSDDKELGSFDIGLGAGFKLNLHMYIHVQANGEISIDYYVQAVSGLQYTDGEFRTIKSFDHGFEKQEISAGFEVGPKMSLNVGWTLIDDIVGAEVYLGLGGTATATPHVGLLCVDLSLYLKLSLGISGDSLIGELLDDHDVTRSWDLYNADNATLLSGHFENFHKVDECTFGKGSLEVTVKGKNEGALSSARVTVINEDGDEAAEDYTSDDGKVTLKQLDAGTYTVEVKATGYQKFIQKNVKIESSGLSTIQAVLMLLREGESEDDPNASSGKNTVTGTVTDALTGHTIDASYKVTKGADNSNGEVVASGTTTDGKYSVKLPNNYYTITFSKNGYIDSKIIVTVRGTSTIIRNVAISPELGEFNKNAAIRIVLTWGETPYDLDSHLLGTLNSGYHVYYSNRDVYNGSTHKANLDVDDTTSYGPETVTIKNVQPGEKFSYYVHDYTNGYNSDSTQMSNSNARVVVYSGESVVGIYHIPTNVQGNIWHVFDYDPDNNSLTPVNTIAKMPGGYHHNYFINQY